MEDSSQLTDEGEITVDTSNQVDKFFEILDASLIFGDVPLNQNRLETYLVDIPFKSEEVSDVDDVSFCETIGETKTISNFQNLTAGSQIYRSSKGYSKLPKVSEEVVEKTNPIDTDTKNNKTGKEDSKFQDMSNEIVENSNVLHIDVIKSNRKEIKGCSKLSNDCNEIPENTSTLHTNIIKNNTKEDEGYSNLPDVSDEITTNLHTLPTETAKNVIKRSKRRSKLQNASDEITNNVLPTETVKNNKKRRKIYPKLSNVSDEIIQHAFPTETVKKNKKGSQKTSKLSDEIMENANILHTDIVKTYRKEKAHSKLPNIIDHRTKNDNILHTETVKNNRKESKDHSKLSNVSVDTSENVKMSLCREIVKNNRRRRPKLPIGPNEIENTSSVHCSIKNIRKKGKIYSMLPDISDDLVQNTNTLSASIGHYMGKGIVGKHSTSILAQNGNNAVISQSESVRNSEVTEKDKISQASETNCESGCNNFNQPYLVKYYGSPEELRLKKNNICPDVMKIFKSISKCEDSSDEVNTSILHTEMPLKSNAKNTSVNESIREHNSKNILSDPISNIQTKTSLHIAEAVKKVNIMQPRVSLADFLDNREVFKSQLKDENDMAYINKIYSSPKLNECLKMNTENSDKSNMITDGRQSSAEPIKPLKRSIRLKNNAKNTIKNVTDKPVFVNDKVFQISDLVKSNEISVIRLEKNSAQDVNNNSTNDNLHVLKHPGKQNAENSYDVSDLDDGSFGETKTISNFQNFTAGSQIYRSSKGYSKLPKVSEEVVEKANPIDTDTKNNKKGKGGSKFQDMSNEIVENTNVLHIDVIKSNRKEIKGCSKKNKRSADKFTRKYISSSKPSLIVSHVLNESDISEKSCLSEVVEECNPTKSSKIGLITMPTRQASDISGSSVSGNGTINKIKNYETSSPFGRKQLSCMDMFKRYTGKVDQTQTPKQVKLMSKTLSPRYKAGLNDNNAMSSDMLLQNTPKNSKHADSVCLYSTPNESWERRSVEKATHKSRSSSRNRSSKSSVDEVATSSSNNATCTTFNNCNTKNFTDSKMPLQGLEFSLAVPFNSANNSGDTSLFSETESSNIQSQNSKKKHRNTISNILNSLQTKTANYFPISVVSPIKRNIVKMENCTPLQNVGESLQKKRKRSQSVHVVSDSVGTEKETVTRAYIKGNQSFSTFDSSIESTSAKRRKRSASVEPKLFYSQNSQTMSCKENGASGKKKQECLNKCKRYSVSNFSSADCDVTARNKTRKAIKNLSIFDSCTLSTSQAKRRKRSVSLEPKSSMLHSVESMSNEVTEASGESEAEYSSKNKSPKRSTSLEHRPDLNPFTDTDLEENRVTDKKEPNFRLKDKMSIKIQQVSSQNTHIPHSITLSELPNIINGENDEDASNSENKYLDTQVSDNYREFESTPSNQQNGYCYLPGPGYTNIPIFNAGNNSIYYGNPFLQVPPQHMNQRVVPYAYGNQFNSFPSPQNFYTLPIFQTGPPVQPSNFQFNNSPNNSFSNPSVATESNAAVNTATKSTAAVSITTEPNAAVNPQNVANLSNTAGPSKGQVPKVIIHNTNTILSTAVNTSATNAVKHKPVLTTKFNKARENIVKNIRKKCCWNICKWSRNYFSENSSLSMLTVQQFYSNPLVIKKFKRKLCADIYNFGFPPKIEYKFDDAFFQSPLREVIKDYVDSLLKAFVYKAPASKQHFAGLAYKNLSFRNCIYFTDSMPLYDKELNYKDLICYLSSAALLSILHECKERKLL